MNDTLPGIDGSVLGANTVPETSTEASGRRFALTVPARRGVWGAAVGGGLLALGLAYVLWSRPSRSFLGYFTRRNKQRWSFAR